MLRELYSEARRDVSYHKATGNSAGRQEAREEGDSGRRCDSGSCCVEGEDNTNGQFISCSRHLVAGPGGHQAGLDVLGAKNLGKFTKQRQLPWQEEDDLEVSKSVAATANKQLSTRAGSAQQTGQRLRQKLPMSICAS